MMISLSWAWSYQNTGPATRVKAGLEHTGRSLQLTETLRVRIPQPNHSLRLWIPKIPSDAFQSAELLEIRSPWRHTTIKDPDFGNPLLYFEAAPATSEDVEIVIRYKILRKEQRGLDQELGPVSNLYKNPRGLIVINERIREIARETAKGLKDPMDKARALYHYVLSHVDYDTRGSGWGRGDVVYACQIGKGNCTDFHSLFIALALAQGIPARFQIGYPIPDTPKGFLSKPYHCWAEFHIQGKGWIPVDISEAWKHPTKADYYFGRLDENRVLVSTGRHLRLSAEQKGAPLNYLVKPYMEMDGRPYEDFVLVRSYENLQ